MILNGNKINNHSIYKSKVPIMTVWKMNQTNDTQANGTVVSNGEYP